MRPREGVDAEDVEIASRHAAGANITGSPRPVSVTDPPDEATTVSKSVLWPCQSRKLIAETTLLPPPGGLLPELHDALRVSVGQRLEQRAIHEAEDGAVGADAEREGQDGNRREAGLRLRLRNP